MRKTYIIIDLMNLKEFLRTGRIIPEPTKNGAPQFDDDPCRLFANTFDCVRHFCGRSFLLFLMFDRDALKLTSEIFTGNGIGSFDDIQRVAGNECFDAIGVYGFGMEHTIRGILKKYGENLNVEQHREWFV